jgi:catechol 2,3-dioxygenase-like lactoylglutathione lyase family enzyme
VHDLEKARAFYEDALGLPVARTGSFGYELLDAPPHVGVHPATHPDARALVGRHTGLTFEVVDLLGLCSRLGERGVRVVAEPLRRLDESDWIDAIVDIPFALPTAVSGLALCTVLAPNGWIGRALQQNLI